MIDEQMTEAAIDITTNDVTYDVTCSDILNATYDDTDNATFDATYEAADHSAIGAIGIYISRNKIYD